MLEVPTHEHVYAANGSQGHVERIGQGTRSDYTMSQAGRRQFLDLRAESDLDLMTGGDILKVPPDLHWRAFNLLHGQIGDNQDVLNRHAVR